VGEPRRYRSDDRDLDGHDLELVVLPPDGNGDWYVSIVDHGDKIGPTVRVTTSGAPRGQELVCVAVAKLFRAMGGESIQDEAGADLTAFLRLRDGEEESEEVASLRTEVERLTAERDELLAVLQADTSVDVEALTSNGPIARVFSRSCLRTLDRAPNFTSFKIVGGYPGEAEVLAIVTIRRPGGNTPEERFHAVCDEHDKTKARLADETTRANLWEGVAKRLGAASQ